MAWKCDKCGFAANEDGTGTCKGCGDVRLGRLVLASEATGRELRMAIDTAVGRRLLVGLAGDEAQYASEPQFTIFRDAAAGHWCIRREAGARNATWVNGAELADEPVALETGSVISIGPEKMRLSVRQEF